MFALLTLWTTVRKISSMRNRVLSMNRRTEVKKKQPAYLLSTSIRVLWSKNFLLPSVLSFSMNSIARIVMIRDKRSRKKPLSK